MAAIVSLLVLNVTPSKMPLLSLLTHTLGVLPYQRPLAAILAANLRLQFLSSSKENGWTKDHGKANLNWELVVSAYCLSCRIWDAVAAASHLIDLSLHLSYNDPRFFSGYVCTFQEELITCFPSILCFFSLSIFCPITTVIKNVVQEGKLRLENVRGVQDSTWPYTE